MAVDFGIASYDIKLVNIDDIIMTPFNPVSRTEEDNLKSLKKDIMLNGMMSPPVCEHKAGKYHLADGNRRITCLKLLNFKKVPIVIRESNQSVAIVFKSANSHTKQITTANQLEIFLSEEAAVNDRNIKEFTKVADKFGKDFLERELVNNNYALGILKQAINVSKYINDTSTESVKSILQWMIKHNLSNSINMWIRGKLNPLHVKYCFKKDLKFDTSDMMSISDSDVEKMLNEIK